MRLKAMGAAKTLLRDQGRIPAERRAYLREIVSKAYPGRAIADVAAERPPPKVRSNSVDDDSLEARCLRQITREANGDLAAKILEFEVAWRKCFVDSLQPSHLPEGWKVDHTIVPRARHRAPATPSLPARPRPPCGSRQGLSAVREQPLDGRPAPRDFGGGCGGWEGGWISPR